MKNAITEGNILKEMLKFCIPIMIGTLFQQLYNTVDVIVVGKFVSSEALACVGGSSGMIINLFTGFFVGITSGITVIIAKYYGAADNVSLKNALHTSIAISLIGGILFSFAGILFLDNILKLLGTPAELMSGSSLYLRIYFLGMTFTFLFNTGSAILRAIGDSRTPLYYLMACCFLNIALDVLLVAVLHLGIAGVAIATGISQFVSSVLILHKLTESKPEYRLEIRQIKVHRTLAKSTMMIGLPAGFQSIMNSLSGMIMTYAINQLGANAIAGNTAYAKLDGIYWMVSNAFAVTIATFVSQNIGANKTKRVHNSIQTCLILDLAISLFISAFFLLTSNHLLFLFTNDPEVISQALLVMKAIAPYYALVPLYEVLASALRGMENVKIPMIINIFGLCGVRAFYILALKNPSTIYQIIISCPVSWAFTAALTVLYYIYFVRKSPVHTC